MERSTSSQRGLLELCDLPSRRHAQLGLRCSLEGPHFQHFQHSLPSRAVGLRDSLPMFRWLISLNGLLYVPQYVTYSLQSTFQVC